MGISSSRPVPQSARPEHEYPANSARRTPVSEKVASGASRAFSAAWFGLTYVLGKLKDLIMLPVRILEWLTPNSWKAWLAEKLSAILNMLRALYERGEVWLNRKEIDQLTEYFREEREVTEEIRTRLGALPESVQREFNRIYREQLEAETEATDELANLVNAQAARLHAMRDRMNHARQQAGDTNSAAAPAPSRAPTPPQPAAPALSPPEHSRRAQLQANIDQMTRELAQLDTQYTED